jgi:anthranilate phosphoribosyltransferase
MAHALQRLGCEEAMVVHGLDGLDEVSTIGKTSIAHLKEGQVKEFETMPRDFGVKRALAADLKVTTVDGSAETLFRILNGGLNFDDSRVEFVLVNSAVGVMVGGKVDNFEGGMDLARRSIESGAAYCKLKALVKASGGNLSRIEELETKYD